ncbi:hypothetical protein KP509_39G058000 [Ceratopteris richardii]|nr:hypothetical protein KP509_39G058000 [Ceratopteris richardii]
MYQRPDYVTPGIEIQAQNIDPRKVQEHFEDFYEDLFEELSKFGELESLNVCDNMADHMVGNVYAQFREEEQAAAALQGLSGRFYAGRPIIVDFSPVTDFREATCRQFEENMCNRGGYCNFMHLKKTSRELRKRLFGNRRRRSRSRSRSRSPRKERERYPENYHGGYGGNRGFRRDRPDVDERKFDRDDRKHRRRDQDRGHSPHARRNRSPVREGSVERRAKIEQWNREREELQRNGGN